jgi:hypothetical protein
MIDFGFDKDGGFMAVDHERKVASYAYRSSPIQDKAAHATRDERLEQIAIEMLAGESEWMHRLHPDFYVRICAKLGKSA